MGRPPTVRGGAPDLDEPGTLTMLGRQVDYWWSVFRRTWMGSVVSYFLQPWLYIAAMGLLLGGYIDDASSGVGGAPTYLDFIAPGLLAATAMQVGTGEVMWPVMGALKWKRTYFGMIATPLRVTDIVAGHLAFAMFRVATATVVFVAALAVIGIFSSVLGALGALGAALLVGLTFVTPVYAFSAGARSEQGFALIYRLGIMPMFLFSGAFFPVENLSEPLEWVARLTPLWHGVELCRMSSLEDWRPVALLHIGYLVALSALGARLAVRRLTGRLVV
jgi:lipooligosaccharide transport system permease protein